MRGNTPKERAKHLKHLLRRVYEDHASKQVTECNVTDILTDLRHMCDRYNIDFFNCDRIARDHYQTEAHAQSLEVA